MNDRRPSAMLFVILLASSFTGPATPAPARASTRPLLLVYLQTPMTANALQKLLSRELPEADVLVLSRAKDFERRLAEKRHDAVLALRPVLSAHALEPHLRGVRDDRDVEPYVLVSLASHEPSPVVLASARLGVVDLLGRKGTARFVSDAFDLSKPPRITRVIKEEDLLPLLQFRAADAIVVPERIAARFRSTSALELVTAAGPRAEVGLACIAFTTDAGRAVLGPALLKMGSAAKEQLGVEDWR